MTQDSSSTPPSFPAPQVRPPAPASTASATPPWWNTPPSWFALMPRRHSTLRRFFTGLMLTVFLASLGVNVYLVAILATQLERGFDKTVLVPGKEDQIVAVYGIEGIINGSSATAFDKFSREVVKNKAIKAVVLRVVTPGGTVAGSDQIADSLKKIKAAGKPIVVSMGSMAASGGYYISAGADEIIAEPTTITGSIGVIAEWMVFKGTLDKIGAESVVIKSSHARGWKDEMSPFKAPEQRQLAHMQSVLDQMQERFEKVVRDGRGDKLKTRSATYSMEAESGKAESKPAPHTETEPFNGKIYLAQDAKTLGLVDDIGYQSQAVERAEKLAGLSKSTVMQYEKRRGMMETLLDSSSSSHAMIDARMLDDVKTPKILMLWRPE